METLSFALTPHPPNIIWTIPPPTDKQKLTVPKLTCDQVILFPFFLGEKDAWIYTFTLCVICPQYRNWTFLWLVEKQKSLWSPALIGYKQHIWLTVQLDRFCHQLRLFMTETMRWLRNSFTSQQCTKPWRMMRMSCNYLLLVRIYISAISSSTLSCSDQAEFKF